MQETFRLKPDFVATYADKTPPFGFNGLGELVYLRTYSRIKDAGTQEKWHETVERVVNGTYTMQKRWIIQHNLGWSERKAQRSAQEMYDRIWNMKFLPPGRGLWAMGSPLTEEKGLFAALNNCAFVSTQHLDKDLSEPFTFLMDASMLGIGVGFDTKGAGLVTIQDPKNEFTAENVYIIPDTREGWVESLRMLLEAFMLPDKFVPIFDYTQIRPAGEPIKGFGGVASGPEPLRKMHEQIVEVLRRTPNAPITVTQIVDVMNLIGTCVVAGNVRRTAEIAFGAQDSTEFLDLKNYEKNPQRAEYGWTSNNSILATVGMDYSDPASRTALNGEPGYVWLENMRAFGRMGDAPDNRDKRVMGANPCVEQSLESYELCCLVETFPFNHDDIEDYKRTLKFAYLYAKTVTLGKTPWAKTNRVLLRNRRIGLSQSGIQQAIYKLGINEYKAWCEEGYKTVRYYDDVYSEWLTIPKSIKVTSVKPSGSVSLLAGATPGMHWPEDKHYIRRMRIAAGSSLIQPLLDAGYDVEPDAVSADTVVVSVPVRIMEPLRTVAQVSVWEQLSMAAFLQKYWADNQVSATVSFHPDAGREIEFALEYFQYQLKGVSFLPIVAEGAYAQMPYEGITREKYTLMAERLKPLNFGVTMDEAEAERFCDGAACVI